MLSASPGSCGPCGDKAAPSKTSISHYFDSSEEHVMYEPTIEQLYYFLTQLYKSMRFQIVCDGEDVNFVVHKGRKRLRKIMYKK